MPTRTLIIGCGYIGLPLALRLAGEGHRVTGWVHSAESAEALAGQPFETIITGSVGSAKKWESVAPAYDRIVHCASSSRGGVEAYREVFLQGMAHVNAYQPQARRIMVSSTSVYGQTEGEIVTEESAALPSTETGKILVAAEEQALASGAIVVRSSGIYGPGRGVLFAKFRRGEAVIEGDGRRWLNQIHQRDLVDALAHLATAGGPGQIYNATDDTPVTLLSFYAWCSDYLALPMPPAGPVDPHRKRGLTSKRVSNGKLRATGWSPVYPSFREGICADEAGAGVR